MRRSQRFSDFPRHAGPRGSTRAWATESGTGRITIRLAIPSGSGRTTVVELPVGAARDAAMVLAEAVADARKALDALCASDPSLRFPQKRHEFDEEA